MPQVFQSPNIVCLKSFLIGHGRAVLAPASLIAKLGLLGRQELVRPFHVLCARISNKIYLESLRHTRSPCAVSFTVPFNFIRFLISALCRIVKNIFASNRDGYTGSPPLVRILGQRPTVLLEKPHYQRTVKY